MTKKLSINISRTESLSEIYIGSGLLGDSGYFSQAFSSGTPKKAAIVSNEKVFGLYGERVERSFREAGIEVFTHLIGDGEEHKNFRTLEKLLEFFSTAGIGRTDIVAALGGGVVGDVTGFAASVHVRGVSLIQIPTTLLSMIDSSVGGKTAVNTAFGKNLVGSFYQPGRVLIDVETLATLPKREVTAGLCEAIKQAAIGGGELFDLTTAFLGRDLKNSDGTAEFIAAHVEFKAAVVQADEREDPSIHTSNSRKILNFGHTFAHALEKATGYEYLKHGEAVGHGILFAAALSKKLEILTPDEVELLNDVVHRAGDLPPINDIDPADIFRSFKFDKKLVNNSLQWVLLESIGNPVIVPSENIPEKILMAAIEEAVPR